jgi:hypothetical protein
MAGLRPARCFSIIRTRAGSNDLGAKLGANGHSLQATPGHNRARVRRQRVPGVPEIVEVDAGCGQADLADRGPVPAACDGAQTVAARYELLYPCRSRIRARRKTSTLSGSQTTTKPAPTRRAAVDRNTRSSQLDIRCRIEPFWNQGDGASRRRARHTRAGHAAPPGRPVAARRAATLETRARSQLLDLPTGGSH